MVLTYKDELLLHEQPQQPRSLQLNRSPRPVLTASRQNLIPAPLYERRNLVISPLAPPNTPSSPNITSPRTPFVCFLPLTAIYYWLVYTYGNC